MPPDDFRETEAAPGRVSEDGEITQAFRGFFLRVVERRFGTLSETVA